MQITSLYPPKNGGTLYDGRAESTRGVRYMFYATRRGETLAGVFRETKDHPLPDGRTFWLQVKAPAALVDLVRQTFRQKRALEHLVSATADGRIFALPTAEHPAIAA